MKLTQVILATLFLPLLISGCDHSQKLVNIEGQAQGTTYHLSWWNDEPVDTIKLKTEIYATLAEIDKEISNYRNDSLIEIFNKSTSTDWQDLPGDIIDLLDIANTVYKESNGCYDPTMKPLFDSWGFRKGTLTIPSAEQIAKIKERIGFNKIVLDVENHKIRKVIPDVAIDMSSMGEGYTVWRLASIFESFGIYNYLLEIGGDMYIKGGPPDRDKWRIGIARPLPDQMAIEKVVEVNSQDGVSINTSGTYQHHYDLQGKRFSHIFDPRTGAPVVHNLVSSTAIGNDPRITDAWATAMLCMGKDEGFAAAEKNSLSIFFIEQQGNKLMESMSPALEKNETVSFK